ncbi:MAG: dehydrogenase [Burkholderiales bacterium RIFCSPHIGHO2_12_FULL_69_20]|nr:MAG: dehydrogenase [Burkholderiales bacterium RIFCSPHIGHO2_12_FULL_69_20]
MDYLLLIIEPPAQRGTRTEAEGREAYARMQRFGEALQAQGRLKAVQSLASHASAVRVRGSGHRAQVLDGPFAEAKEMVGGFFLVDCASLAEAVDLARDCPAAEWATVEVRALAPCFDDSLGVTGVFT